MNNNWKNIAITITISVTSIFLITTAGGWTLGLTELWLFNYLVFIPFPVRLALASTILITAFLSIRIIYTDTLFNSKAIYKFAIILKYIHVQTVGRLLMTLLSGLCFWLFREQTWSGDAYLKIELLSTTTLQTNPYIWKEPLDSILTYIVTEFISFIQLGPEEAIAMLSVLSGMVYVWSILWLAAQLWQNSYKQAFFSMGMMSLGSTLLWFGHIENYSLVTAASIATVALGIGYLLGISPLWPVGLSIGTAVSLHPQAIFILPACLLLLINNFQWRRLIQNLIIFSITAMIVPLTTVAIMLSLGINIPWNENSFAGDPQLFLTFRQMADRQQIIDAINNLWLVAPLLPVLAPTGILALWQKKLYRDNIFLYLTACMIGILMYHFTFQNDLPRHRDWDLYAIVGPIFTAWGLYGLIRGNIRHSFYMLPAFIFSFIMTVSWTSTHHHFTIISPKIEEVNLYERYKLASLTSQLFQASIKPMEPICQDSVGCERVTLTEFIMPQDGDRRATIFAHAPAHIELPLNIPARPSFLWLSPALDPDAWGWGGDGVTFRVFIKTQTYETLLWNRHLNPANPEDLDWQEVFISLDQYHDEDVTIILETDPGPANNSDADRAGWGMPWLMSGTLDTRYSR